jgi:hypothetical protein
MRKFFFFFGIILLGTGLGGFLVQYHTLPSLQANISHLQKQIKNAGYDVSQWENIINKTDSLPSVYPFSRIKNAFSEVQTIVQESVFLQETSQKLFLGKLSTKTFFSIFDSIHRIDESLHIIAKNIDSFPTFLLPKSVIEQRDWSIRIIHTIRKNLADIHTFEKIFRNLAKNEERLLILLQNQNEPRPTGGFVGSMIVVDFNETEIQWKFFDTYALDRQISIKNQLPAPSFFHDLSQTISLRDANFWPDFSVSSEKYRHFFASLEQKVPHTIVALNLNVIREMLRFTEPIHLSKWGIMANEQNFDLILQFLVEAQIAGRFDVKQPVMTFAEELLSSYEIGSIQMEKLLSFDWNSFMTQKNILAHSLDSQLQELFEKWNIDGIIRKKQEADNFLYFDFVSIGANKSEKFVWTKIHHDSDIGHDGTVKNTLHITRNHALKKGEISRLLEKNTWSENIKMLLDEELIWKLGAGQNRTILRLWIPRKSEVLHYQNPSGNLGSTISENPQFRILEIPLFVSPGEKLQTTIQYKTHVHRGSAGWRPYFLQLVGTPGREKTTFLSTISTPINGSFRADTKNIGRPENLIDTDFRAVIEFD